jgi:hypothetical protein
MEVMYPNFTGIPAMTCFSSKPLGCLAINMAKGQRYGDSDLLDYGMTFAAKNYQNFVITI